VVDTIDTALLQALQANAHASFRELADTLGIEPSEVQNRIKGLERHGVLEGSTIVVDPTTVGFQVVGWLVIEPSFLPGAPVENLLKNLGNELLGQHSSISFCATTADNQIWALIWARDESAAEETTQAIRDHSYIRSVRFVPLSKFRGNRVFQVHKLDVNEITS
jgi:DNA-binding Lrp family transcriptional regulator